MVRRISALGLIAASAPWSHAEASPNASWAALASAAVKSPFVAGSGDTASQWVAPDGRQITLTIKGPHPTSSAVVSVALPPAGTDATPVLAAAIASARTSGAATISLAVGTYTFKTLDKSQLGHLVISGLHDVTIRGNGSNFVFMNDADGIYVTECQRLVLQSVRVSYGFNTVSLGTMVNQSGRNALVVTSSQYPITSADGIGAIAQYDPVNKIFVPNGTRIYQPASPGLVAADTYVSSSFNASGLAGKTFAILHHYYGGTAVELEDSFLSGAQQDQDITLDNVSVQSGPGMGIIAYGVKRGLFILNSSVVPRAGGLFSTEYDAMHLQQVGGDVYIEDNTISGQGDDAINAASPISPLVSLDPSGTQLVLGVYSRFVQTADTLAFFDAGDDYLGSTTVKSVVSTGYPNSSFVLSSAVPGAGPGDVVRDVALTNDRMVIARNTISNCECHAILLQTPDALVLDNTVSGTANGGIEALSNIGTFQEGTGAINDIIENNTLSSTGFDPSITMPWGAISLYGATNAGLQTSPINYNVQILNNSVQNATGTGCVTIASSSGVRVAGNLCSNTNVGQAAHTPAIDILDADTVALSGNTLSGASTGPVAVGASTAAISQ